MPLLTRTLASVVRKAIRTFPAVVLTGPRQSGKTTLLKTLFFKTHRWADLENPDVRERAMEDPKAFLDRYQPPVVLDEIQYVPQLLSYIRSRIDEDRRPGRWLLSGSQQFGLMANVTQSLAGRAAVLSLLPFSYAEGEGCGARTQDPAGWLRRPRPVRARGAGRPLAEIILRGSYPEIASNRKVDRQLWCSSYLSTYLERDVRNLSAVGDLGQFSRFMRLCAARTGGILNLSEMARELGVSVPTARRWLSLLETGYQVYLLYPYYRNVGKRIVKAPKLYFTDTGLATFLLGIHDKEALLDGPCLGGIFETFVVSDFLKRFLHSGRLPSMYYLRSRDGLEVDLVLEFGGKLHLIEIKAAMTVTAKHAAGLVRLGREKGVPTGTKTLITRAGEDFQLPGGVAQYDWRGALMR